MSLAHLADTGLPFNRKERFFTGTVLPMLVCAGDFAHFGRFTELLGLGRIEVDARPASANVQFFTEYGFAESGFGDAAVARFPDAPARKDTPDVLIYVAGPRRALIAIEAKMFDRPSARELDEQLGAQAALVRYIAGRLDVEAARVAHVALLPAALAGAVGALAVPTVTWEQVMAAYADVAPAQYGERAAQRAAWGENARGRCGGRKRRNDRSAVRRGNHRQTAPLVGDTGV